MRNVLICASLLLGIQQAAIAAIPNQAEIIITEFMVQPTSADSGQWVEIYNEGSNSVDLQGWVLKDGDATSPETHTINAPGGSLVLAPGAYMVLGQSLDNSKNGTVWVDYAYGAAFTLDPDGDEIILERSAGEVDRVEYTSSTHPIVEGASAYLVDLGADNGAPTAWTQGTYVWGTGLDRGTPHQANTEHFANTMTNSDCEEWTWRSAGDPPDFWYRSHAGSYSSAGTDSVRREQTHVHSGSSAMRIDFDANTVDSCFIHQRIKVVQGYNYQLSAWIDCPSSVVQAQLVIDYEDGNGNFIGGSTGPVFSATSGYVQATLGMNAYSLGSQSDIHARVGVLVSKTQSSSYSVVYVDDVSFQMTSPMELYSLHMSDTYNGREVFTFGVVTMPRETVRGRLGSIYLQDKGYGMRVIVPDSLAQRYSFAVDDSLRMRGIMRTSSTDPHLVMTEVVSQDVATASHSLLFEDEDTYSMVHAEPLKDGAFASTCAAVIRKADRGDHIWLAMSDGSWPMEVQVYDDPGWDFTLGSFQVGDTLEVFGVVIPADSLDGYAMVPRPGMASDLQLIAPRSSECPVGSFERWAYYHNSTLLYPKGWESGSFEYPYQSVFTVARVDATADPVMAGTYAAKIELDPSQAMSSDVFPILTRDIYGVRPGWEYNIQAWVVDNFSSADAEIHLGAMCIDSTGNQSGLLNYWWHSPSVTSYTPLSMGCEVHEGADGVRLGIWGQVMNSGAAAPLNAYVDSVRSWRVVKDRIDWIQRNTAEIGQDSVEVLGIVTQAGDAVTSGQTMAAVQDTSGRGIFVENTATVDPLFQRGAVVSVRGTLGDVDGNLTIGNYHASASLAPMDMPEPLAEATGALAAAAHLDGTYAQATGELVAKLYNVAASAAILELNDGSGTLECWVFDTSGLDLSSLQVGGHYTVRGVVTNSTLSGVTALTISDQADIEEASGVGGEAAALPDEFALESAYPNPFNPTVNVVLALPEASRIHAVVYDILGREVATLVDGRMTAGYHRLAWFAEGPSGVYFVRVTNHRGWTDVRKLLYLK